MVGMLELALLHVLRLGGLLALHRKTSRYLLAFEQVNHLYTHISLYKIYRLLSMTYFLGHYVDLILFSVIIDFKNPLSLVLRVSAPKRCKIRIRARSYSGRCRSKTPLLSSTAFKWCQCQSPACLSSFAAFAHFRWSGLLLRVTINDWRTNSSMVIAKGTICSMSLPTTTLTAL